MIRLAKFRRRQQGWGRSALGLFVAVWLNLALQPCAMAYQPDDQAPMQMQGHGGMHEGMHGDSDDQEPCADGLNDCTIEDDLNHDGRSSQIKLKDPSADSPTAFVHNEFTVSFNPPGDELRRPRYSTIHAGAPPPLHVLNCVYLK